MSKGILYLVPATLGDTAPEGSLPAYNESIMRSLRHYIVEDVRSARRFLKKTVPEIVIDELDFTILNEHTHVQEVPALLKPLLNGMDAGLLSEAGMPGVADPGAGLIALAHDSGIRVVPLAGPSSLLLALAASGFNGQHFAFQGYLPIGKSERVHRIRELENEVWLRDQTQIFIEAPYRNMQLLAALVENCRLETRLCVASNLTLPGELIISRQIRDWKKTNWPDLHKKPAVFLLYK